MRIVRALVLVLVALNLLLFAAVRGCFGPSGSGEPDRLAQQITPERIRVVEAGRPDAAPAAKSNGKAKERPVPKPEPKLLDKSEAKPEAKAENERDVDACQHYAPLSRDQAARIGALAKATDAQVTLSEKSLEAPTSYWVFIPSTGDRQDMDKHIDELRSAGISDWYIQSNGPDKGGISLGVFKTEPMATVLKDRLLGKGITGIRVRGRDSPGAKLAVELTAKARELAALEEQITAALPGIAAQACVAGH